MDSNKLGKKIRDWTASLGFRLPDGTSPPADFFAFLTVTPHRRQLWVTLMEAVQPRQKVEVMRKQICIAKLQERKKQLMRCESKQITDRIDLWYKQNALEFEIKEKRKAVSKMERNVMEKASGLLFEIHKVAELESQVKEFSEKAMVLKLLSKRENKIAEDLNRDMLKLKSLFCKKSNAEKSLESVKNELLNSGDCMCLQDDIENCKLLSEIKKFSESGVTDLQLWEEVMRWKKTLLSHFGHFLEGFNSAGKTALSEKGSKIEEVFSQSVMQLKQKIIEKSLQVIISLAEGKQLDLEVEKLEERVLEGVCCGALCSESLKEISDRMNASSENETALKNIESYLNFIGVQSYQEFLKEKMKKLDEEIQEKKRSEEQKSSKDGEKRLQFSFKDFESIIDEINTLQSEGKKLEQEIITTHQKLQAAFHSQKEEIEAKTKAKDLRDVVDKLKMAAEKQVNFLLETPLAAFRTVKSSSESMLFEFESATHCLNNNSGELKHFFTAMLIPPSNDLQKILSEVDRRKKRLKQVKKFVSEREKLAALQKKTLDRLTSFKYDRQLCERNFRDSDRILCGITYKVDELLHDLDFVDKILKNWVEQPYRLMVRGTIEGKSLREYEEKYRKAMKS